MSKSRNIARLTPDNTGYLNSSNLAFNYTPLNKAGDTMSGALNMGTNTISNSNSISANNEIRVLNNPARLYFFTWSGASINSYTHLKTNRKTNESQMHSIRFDGYDYGNARPIMACYGWYNYGGSDSMISAGSWGTHTISGYRSSDGYAVLVINHSTYYVGFTLSQFQSGPQGMADITITNTANTTGASGAF